MKTKLKAVTLATAITTVGLCFTISHAAGVASDINANEMGQYKLVIVNKLKTVTNTTANSDAFQPALFKNELFTTETFAQMFNKPLVKIPLDNIASNTLKRPVKKNEFFELATVLNDKLHLLISTFTDRNSSISTKQMTSKPKTTTAKVCSKARTKHI